MTERLDRIEAAIEELTDSLKETRAIANSNAKAIQALNDAGLETEKKLKEIGRDYTKLWRECRLLNLIFGRYKRIIT
jgi:thymidylate synthase